MIEKESRDGKAALDLQVQVILVKLWLCKLPTDIEQLLPSQTSPHLKYSCYSWLKPVFVCLVWLFVCFSGETLVLRIFQTKADTTY